jgi:hypothetical protein
MPFLPWYSLSFRPKCAEHHLVVLGNLDYHTWSTEATAAPAHSQLGLHLLTSFKLPDNDEYIL